MAEIDAYLTEVLEKAGLGSAFHPGDPARVRLFGDLTALRPDKLAPEFVKQALYEIMPKPAVRPFRGEGRCGLCYTFADKGRFRVNVMRQLNGMGAVPFAPLPSKATVAR